jgi:hypothetical protein
MKVRIWRYDVAPNVRDEFVREYGPHGSWAALFAQSPEFVDVTLYANVTNAGSYLTVDRFADEDGWNQFRLEHDAEYQRLGDALQHLTIAQEELA